MHQERQIKEKSLEHRRKIILKESKVNDKDKKYKIKNKYNKKSF